MCSQKQMTSVPTTRNVSESRIARSKAIKRVRVRVRHRFKLKKVNQRIIRASMSPRKARTENTVFLYQDNPDKKTHKANPSIDSDPRDTQSYHVFWCAQVLQKSWRVAFFDVDRNHRIDARAGRYDIKSDIVCLKARQSVSSQIESSRVRQAN
ncbi:hypothetical protein BDN70DRAFT_888732 [Pholiota conissans]|uniref:Uncharacterized protein n=1 Tax=Pholiota conissans TaxID=109636 RepID=A0A9P6CSQ0_9AGAR|nr:hypothetical protein BDN70DRAFT_888732 [Pholiota conissans]